MTQWKMIYLARRNPQLSAAEFPQAWREHSALGRQCKNVQDKITAVTQCARVLDQPTVLAGVNIDYDGVNLLTLRDRAAADEIWTDAETLAIMRPDEPRVFSTYVRNFAFTAREQLLRAGEAGEIGVHFFLRARAGTAFDERALLAGVDEAVLAQAGRLVGNCVDGPCPPGYEYAYVLEAWYPSLDAVASAFGAAPAWEALPAALLDAVDVAGSVCMLTRVTHRRA